MKKVRDDYITTKSKGFDRKQYDNVEDYLRVVQDSGPK